MRMDQLPAHAAHKLLVLDQEARQLAEEADGLAKKITWCRRIISRQLEDPDVDVNQLHRDFPALQAREAEVRKRASAVSWVSEHARRWVEQLGDDVALETAAVAVKPGDDLT